MGVVEFVMVLMIVVCFSPWCDCGGGGGGGMVCCGGVVVVVVMVVVVGGGISGCGCGGCGGGCCGGFPHVVNVRDVDAIIYLYIVQ